MLIGNYFKKIENKYKNYFFSGLSFKSSECKRNDIFFAIKGNKNNGNQYVDEAIKKGAKIIISERKFQGVKKNILYLKSKNVRKLLAELSYKIFKDRPNNLIAVTGTNGKSSVADFYFQILSLNKKKVASIGTLGIKTSYNTKPVINTTLDPITLASELSDLKKKKINNVILEASSHGLKQNRLNGLNFKSAVFTNLSHDHLDYHKNFKDYLNSKMYLFENLMKKGGNIITDINIPQFRILKKISKKKKT